jgi:hypothetical protein
MDIAEEAVEMIEVRFRTELDKYRITEKAFSIPVTLNKGSLSETINHLLETRMSSHLLVLAGHIHCFF